jgi:hypothetical protein
VCFRESDERAVLTELVPLAFSFKIFAVANSNRGRIAAPEATATHGSGMEKT